MREWKFWDWIGYGSIGLSAFFIAFNEGLKRMPDNFLPSITSSAIWNFLPLIFFILGSITLFIRHYFWIPKKETEKQTEFVQWPRPYTPNQIAGRKFYSETVLLDGNSYFKCDFTHCKFVYNGTTTIKLRSCNFIGTQVFSSDNPAVIGTFVLSFAFGDALSKGEIVGLDESNFVEKVVSGKN